MGCAQDIAAVTLGTLARHAKTARNEGLFGGFADGRPADYFPDYLVVLGLGSMWRCLQVRRRAYIFKYADCDRYPEDRTARGQFGCRGAPARVT